MDEKMKEKRPLDSFESLTELLGYMDEIGMEPEDPKRHFYYDRYIHMKSRVAGVPQSGCFELTPQCNLDCRMCYVHLNKEQMAGQKELEVETWLSLIDQAVQAGMLKAQLTGGEAMLYSGFTAIYMHLIDKGIRPVVLSNGLLLSDERIEFFKNNPPSALQISVYGDSQDTYERVTGFRVWEKVLSNLIKAKEIGCTLTISITPSGYLGSEQVRGILAWAKEHGITARLNSDLNEPYEETGRKVKDFELIENEFVAVRRIQREIDGVAMVPFEGELPEENPDTEPVKGLRCGAGRALFSINWRGEMMACLDLPFKSYPLRDGFRIAWEQIHRMAENYLIPGECIGCVYNQLCNRCPVIHKKNASGDHVDRGICRRTKRMVQEGIMRLGTGREMSEED